eukprot:11363930-Karenia_brevis.AAC.1
MAGHFSPKFAAPLATLHTQMNDALSSIGSSFPRSHHPPTQFACPRGHYRASTDFDFLAFTKAIWCHHCAKAYSGKKWSCKCGKSWFNCTQCFCSATTARHDQTDSKEQQTSSSHTSAPKPHTPSK